MPFANQYVPSGDINDAIPMHFDDYVALVRFTGRAIRRGKGALPSHLGTLLRGVGLCDRAWLRTIADFPEDRFAALGECDLIRARAAEQGKRHAHGIAYARGMYTT